MKKSIVFILGILIPMTIFAFDFSIGGGVGISVNQGYALYADSTTNSYP